MAIIYRPKSETATPKTGAAAGEMAAAAPGQAPAPGTKEAGVTPETRRQSGSFVNLQKYLQSNVGEGQRLAESIAHGVESKAQEGMAELGKAEQEYRQTAYNQNVRPDLDAITSITPKIIQGTATEEEKNKLRQQMESKPAGPIGVIPDADKMYEWGEQERKGKYDPVTNIGGIKDADQAQLDKMRQAQQDPYTQKASMAIEERVLPKITEAEKTAEMLAPTKRTPEQEALYGKAAPAYQELLRQQFKKPTYTAGQSALDTYLLQKAPYAASRFQRLKETISGTTAPERQPGELEADYQQRAEQSKILKSYREQIGTREQSSAAYAREQRYQSQLAAALAKQALYGVDELPTPENFGALTEAQRTNAISNAKAQLTDTEQLMGALKDGKTQTDAAVKAAEKELYLAQQAAKFVKEGDSATADQVQRRIQDAQTNLDQLRQSKLFYDNAVSNAYTAREYYRKTHNDLVKLAWQILHPGEQPPASPGVEIPEESEFGKRFKAYQVSVIDAINKKLFNDQLTPEEEQSLAERRDTFIKQLAGVTDLSKADLEKIYGDLGIAMPGRTFSQRQADIGSIDSINKRLTSEDLSAEAEAQLIQQRDSLLTQLAKDLGIQLSPDAGFQDIYNAVKLEQAPTSTMRTQVDAQVQDFNQGISQLDIEAKEKLMDEYVAKIQAGQLLPRAIKEIEPIIAAYNAEIEKKQQAFVDKFTALPTDSEKEALLDNTLETSRGDSATLKGKLAASFKEFYDDYYRQLQAKEDNLTYQLDAYKNDSDKEALLDNLASNIENGKLTGKYATFVMGVRDSHYKKVDSDYASISAQYDTYKTEAGTPDILKQEQYLGQLAVDLAAGKYTGKLADSVNKFIGNYYLQVTNKFNSFKNDFEQMSVINKESKIGEIQKDIAEGRIDGLYREDLEQFIANYQNVVVPARLSDINMITMLDKKLATEDMSQQDEAALIGKRDALLDTLAKQYNLSVKDLYDNVIHQQQPGISLRQTIDKEWETFSSNYSSYPTIEKERFLDSYAAKLTQPGAIPERLVPLITAKIEEYNKQLNANRQSYLNSWFNTGKVAADIEQDMTAIRAQFDTSIKGKLKDMLNTDIDAYWASTDNNYAAIRNTFLNNFKTATGEFDIAASENYLWQELNKAENTQEYTGRLADMVREFAETYRNGLEVKVESFKSQFDAMFVPQKEEEMENIIKDIQAQNLEGFYAARIQDIITDYDYKVTDFITKNLNLTDINKNPGMTITDREYRLLDLEKKINTRDDNGNAEIEGKAATLLKSYISDYWTALNSRYDTMTTQLTYSLNNVNTFIQDSNLQNLQLADAKAQEDIFKALLNLPEAQGRLRDKLLELQTNYYQSLDHAYTHFEEKAEDFKEQYTGANEATMELDLDQLFGSRYSLDDYRKQQIGNLFDADVAKNNDIIKNADATIVSVNKAITTTQASIPNLQYAITAAQSEFNKADGDYAWAKQVAAVPGWRSDGSYGPLPDAVARRDSLKAIADAAAAKLNTAKSNLANANDQLTSYASQIEQQNANKANAQTALNDINTQIQNYQLEKPATEFNIQEFISQQSQMYSDFFQADLTKKQESLKAAESNLGNLQTTVTTKQTEYDTALTKYNTAKSNLDRVNSDVAQLQAATAGYAASGYSQYYQPPAGVKRYWNWGTYFYIVDTQLNATLSTAISVQGAPTGSPNPGYYGDISTSYFYAQVGANSNKIAAEKALTAAQAAYDNYKTVDLANAQKAAVDAQTALDTFSPDQPPVTYEDNLQAIKDAALRVALTGSFIDKANLNNILTLEAVRLSEKFNLDPEGVRKELNIKQFFEDNTTYVEDVAEQKATLQTNVDRIQPIIASAQASLTSIQQKITSAEQVIATRTKALEDAKAALAEAIKKYPSPFTPSWYFSDVTSASIHLQSANEALKAIQPQLAPAQKQLDGYNTQLTQAQKELAIAKALPASLATPPQMSADNYFQLTGTKVPFVLKEPTANDKGLIEEQQKSLVDGYRNVINSGQVTGYLKEKLNKYISEYDAVKKQEVDNAYKSYNEMSREDKIITYAKLNVLAEKGPLTAAQTEIYKSSALFASEDSIATFTKINDATRAAADEWWANYQTTMPNEDTVAKSWVNGDQSLGDTFLKAHTIDADGKSIALREKLRNDLNAEKQRLKDVLNTKLKMGQKLTAAELLIQSEIIRNDQAQATAAGLFNAWKDATIDSAKDYALYKLMQTQQTNPDVFKYAKELYDEESLIQDKRATFLKDVVVPTVGRLSTSLRTDLDKILTDITEQQKPKTAAYNKLINPTSASDGKYVTGIPKEIDLFGYPEGRNYSVNVWPTSPYTLGLDMAKYISYDARPPTLENTAPADKLIQYNNYLAFLRKDTIVADKPYNPTLTFNSNAFVADYAAKLSEISKDSYTRSISLSPEWSDYKTQLKVSISGISGDNTYHTVGGMFVNFDTYNIGSLYGDFIRYYNTDRRYEFMPERQEDFDKINHIVKQFTNKINATLNEQKAKYGGKSFAQWTNIPALNYTVYSSEPREKTMQKLHEFATYAFDIQKSLQTSASRYNDTNGYAAKLNNLLRQGLVRNQSW